MTESSARSQWFSQEAHVSEEVCQNKASLWTSVRHSIVYELPDASASSMQVVQANGLAGASSANSHLGTSYGIWT